MAIKIRDIQCLIVVLSLIVIAMPFPLSAATSEQIRKEKEVSDNTLRLLHLFGEVFDMIQDEYVEEVTDEQLVEAAINGMLTSLDPHSSYLSGKAFKEMRIQTKGQFGGLGIEVTMENGLVKVVSPIDDTPAYKAGIKAGDYVSYIDSDAVMGMTLTEAVEKMRGKVGTDVVLTILREGESEPLEVKITRAVIKIKSVRSHAIDDIGYIRITSFSEQTDGGVKRSIESLKKEIGKDMKGLVLDLRNNPGGLLDQAVAVADIFLDSGEIVSTRSRHSDMVSREHAQKGELAKGLPIAVLINEGSASASEIVAGALQDHNRAVIMGTRSFGKGSVQTVKSLSNQGAVRFTIARYYTPSGRSIQAKGITPDVEVEPAVIEFVSTKNRRKYTEVNLRKHLKKENNDSLFKKKKKKSDKTDKKSGKEDKELFEKDYQLARAVELLKSLTIYAKSFQK